MWVGSEGNPPRVMLLLVIHCQGLCIVIRGTGVKCEAGRGKEQREGLTSWAHHRQGRRAL